MGEIVVQEFITLDGVIQGPGGQDEDRDEGFDHGGWTSQYDDLDPSGESTNFIPEWESRTAALLLGRRTYEIWAGAWGVWDEDAPGMMGEFTRRYNRVPKYVASRTLTEVGWKNSHLLGDVAAEVRRVRDETDGEVRVWGSSKLVRTLAENDLVDEYRLVQYPLVLGTGKKLFPDGFPLARLTLASTRPLSTGVVVNIYRRA
jgi:dihydrofolate reductase